MKIYFFFLWFLFDFMYFSCLYFFLRYRPIQLESTTSTDDSLSNSSSSKDNSSVFRCNSHIDTTKGSDIPTTSPCRSQSHASIDTSTASEGGASSPNTTTDLHHDDLSIAAGDADNSKSTSKDNFKPYKSLLKKQISSAEDRLHEGCVNIYFLFFTAVQKEK